MTTPDPIRRFVEATNAGDAVLGMCSAGLAEHRRAAQQ
jgi:hypothetical protein